MTLCLVSRILNALGAICQESAAAENFFEGIRRFQSALRNGKVMCMKELNSNKTRRTPTSILTGAQIFVLGVSALCGTIANSLMAQTPQPVASGLATPAKIIQTPLGNYIVAEVGTSTPNTSRVSIIDDEGNRRSLISGLPSARNALALSGVSGLYLRGRTLFTVIGEGNPTLPGPVPRTEIVNPNPASPLFSCVLAVTFSANAEKETTGIQLSVADHQALKNGEHLVGFDAEGHKITIQVVTDFPDYIFEPLPALATNVRHSQPYGVVIDDDYLYVNDGGYNLVHKVEIVSGAFETLVRFPNVPNPLFGTIGGPTMEVVPTSIRWNGDQLVVSLLSGFPFPAGTSQVVSIDPQTGARTPLIAGLSSAVDVIPLRQDDETVGYLTLEYSLVHLAGAPGRLRFFDPSGISSTTLATGLVTPASMVYDRKSGEVVIGLISVGQLVSMQLP
jgi:hypothetical protein